MARDTSGRFLKGAKRPANAGRRPGTPNRVKREVRVFLAGLLDEVAAQNAVRERILAGDTRSFFRAYETVYGRPRQTLEVEGNTSFVWEPPARVDEPVALRPGTLVFPQGAHIHDGGEEEHHCHLCHEKYAARVHDKLKCPRCLQQPEGRCV